MYLKRYAFIQCIQYFFLFSYRLVTNEKQWATLENVSRTLWQKEEAGGPD